MLLKNVLLQDPIQSCIQFLEENEFIRLQENGNVYVATPLGQACLASSLPPDEGLSLFRELQRARRCFVLDSDLHIIYQVEKILRDVVFSEYSKLIIRLFRLLRTPCQSNGAN